MSEEALQAFMQARMFSENIRDSFGKQLTENILDKMFMELQQFDEASKSNHLVCGEVTENLQESKDLAAEAESMGE